MGRQVPGDPGWAQLRQGPPQAESQQVPSTQKPLVHSAPCWQLAPFSLVPQLPAMQERPGTHSAEVLHRLKQWGMSPEGSQAKGAQVITGPVTQRPSPSHAPAAVMLLPLHMPAAQRVPTG
jgi:hypothetical protein